MMFISDYPKFNAILKKLPLAGRKRFIDSEIEKLGYRMNRILIADLNKYTVNVSLFKDNVETILFNDASQKFTFNKAIEYSRIIALEHFEFNFIKPQHNKEDAFNRCVVAVIKSGRAKNYSDVAKQINYSKQTISKIRVGKTEINKRMVSAFCHKFDVNELYVFEGSEPLFTENLNLNTRRIFGRNNL